MSFAALGANIFVTTNPLCSPDHAPPAFVYNAETAALTVGPRVPETMSDLGSCMGVGDMLYDLKSMNLDDAFLRALSYPEQWDPAMEWSWNPVPLAAAPNPYEGSEILSYALHPDGRTIVVSGGPSTHTFDTSNGAWKHLGGWSLPFRGQAYFDADLDAWVGLHYEHDGHVCCCPVASMAARPPECKMLVDRLIRRDDEKEPKHWPGVWRQAVSLTYMGDSRFALVENVPRSEDFNDGAVLHVTVFGLRYDRRGELQTKARRATRSYAVSKNTPLFCHAAFWM
uniref:Uncharacterized protein n=1 Tax=Oryza brachyantha TaxID=4533 RepID=J3LDR5_ORYBR